MIGKRKKTSREGKPQIGTELTPWQTVQIARHPQRPVLQDYIRMICSEFIELHGDRASATTRAHRRTGHHRHAARGPDRPQQGQDPRGESPTQFRPGTTRRVPQGASYHAACGKVRVAGGHLRRYAGRLPGPRRRGARAGRAIARNLTEMAGLRTPIIALITGEGGSGGALGIAVADVVLMMSTRSIRSSPRKDALPSCGATRRSRPRPPKPSS